MLADQARQSYDALAAFVPAEAPRTQPTALPLRHKRQPTFIIIITTTYFPTHNTHKPVQQQLNNTHTHI